MKIEFKHIEFPEVAFKGSKLKDTKNKELDVSLEFKTSFESEMYFTLEFEMIIKSGRNRFIQLIALAHFSTNEPMDNAFKESHFADVNAPAIAYPFIRTFIANLTLNSGYNPIILPAYNFAARAEEKKKQLAQ